MGLRCIALESSIPKFTKNITDVILVRRGTLYPTHLHSHPHAPLHARARALREAAGQTQESAHIASALGSDTGLMRQLLEARQEVSRLKRELKETAASSSPQPVRAGTVDIKHKIQLSQVQCAYVLVLSTYTRPAHGTLPSLHRPCQRLIPASCSLAAVWSGWCSDARWLC